MSQKNELDEHVNLPRINEFTQKFLTELMDEKERLGEEFPICSLLIDEAVERLYSTGHVPGKEFYADVLKQKPLKVTQKVFVPVKQYPKFNFTGKILGPKGNSLRRLQEETQCKIAIKGKNSIRNTAKEEELRNSGDPKYAHFKKDLYLEISSVAPPAESYARVAYALAEIRKYIIPDKNDEVSQDQLREMMELNPEASKDLQGVKSHVYKSVLDGKMTNSNSGTKYLNLIKKTAYNNQVQEDMDEQQGLVEEYDSEFSSTVPQYKKMYPNISTRKRPPSSVYTTEIKRVREAPSTSYKPNPYAIYNKFK